MEFFLYKYYIKLYILLTFISFFKFFYVIIITKKLNPNINLIDSMIYKVLLNFLNKKSIKNYLLIFWEILYRYIFIFIFALSIKSLFLAVYTSHLIINNSFIKWYNNLYYSYKKVLIEDLYIDKNELLSDIFIFNKWNIKII